MRLWRLHRLSAAADQPALTAGVLLKEGSNPWATASTREQPDDASQNRKIRRGHLPDEDELDLDD